MMKMPPHVVFFVLLLLLSALSLHCGLEKETVTLYYDEDWQGVPSETGAAFYREVTFNAKDEPLGLVRDYYITGELQGEGTALHIDRNDDNKSLFDGTVTSYYRSGEKESAASFTRGLLNGRYAEWNESGLEKVRMEYREDLLHGPMHEWYESGKLQYLSVYESGKLVNNEFIECDEFGECWKVMFETFDGEGLEWSEEQSDSEASRIGEENYTITSREDGAVATGMTHYEIDTANDFTIEATLRKMDHLDDESACGLIWGMKDWDNYFALILDGTGEFHVFGFADGIRVELVPWTHSDFINEDENLIKIKRVEENIFYSINGELLGGTEFYSFFGHGLGFYVDDLMTVQVSDLTVRQDLSPESFTPPEQGAEGIWRGTGSGILVSSSGYIATNYHVIENAVRIEVDMLRGGVIQTCTAEQVVVDTQNDLAVIRINDDTFEELPRLPYRIDDELQDVGTSVFTLGYPGALSGLGEEVKFTDGRISSQTGYENDVTTYQISTPVQPGSSGGPLFSEQGNLIGIVNAKVMGADNVSYAIKAGYLTNLLSLCPEKIEGGSNALRSKSLPEQIKILKKYVVLIKVQ